MKVDFIDIILFVLFFQLLSLAPFLILQKKEKNQSNIILAVFLFAKALCISNFLSFRLQDYTLAYFPHSFFFGSSFTLLWGPSLYFYIKSLTHKDFKIRKGDSIHLLPFLIHFIYLTFTFHIQSADIKRELIISDAVFPTNISMFVYGFLHASILLYTIASFRMVWQYRSEIKISVAYHNFGAICSLLLIDY